MYTLGKKEQAFLVKTKYKGNVENQKIEFWNLESSHLWNPESMAWNPESKTLLDYLTWGDKAATNVA